MIPLLEEHRPDVDELCRRFGVRRLEVFGSAATGEFRPDESDLDFLVEFEDKGPGYSDRFFGLLFALEEMFGRHVDLVVDSAIRNPYFRQSVDMDKVLLYGRSPRANVSQSKGEYRPAPKAKYLFDILEAANSLAAFTADKTFEYYQRDLMLRRAVEREFEIIGEALAQLARVDEATARRITDYQQVIAFRNVLIHGYATLDDEQVWNVIQCDLPLFRIEVTALLPDDSAHS